MSMLIGSLTQPSCSSTATCDGDSYLGSTRYTTRTLHGAAMLGPSQPRRKCTVYGEDETPHVSIYRDLRP